jgi:hypothetical protein
MLKQLVAFHGSVAAERQSAGAPGLTLVGTAAEAPGEPTALAFSGAAPAGLPEVLEDLNVAHAGGTRYVLTSVAREWLMDAAAAHLHHDVSSAFNRALPPRRVPLAKRCLWSVVLRLAASRSGLALLAALRRPRD